MGSTWGGHTKGTAQRSPGVVDLGAEASAVGFEHEPLALTPLDRQNRASFWSPSSVANIKSAEKRARQTVKRRAHNVAARSKLRTAIKGVMNAVNAGNKEEAVESLKAATPVIDSAVNKGLIHRNKASRHKRELNARVKELSAT